jgi:dihydrofolate synthase / folylpolyglutamate synthase
MKNIERTLSDLFDLQKFAIKLGLDNILNLSQYFNNPHLTYPTIHIAGTNGKGSTAIILQNILMQHGLKVGLFTSPHLVRFNERIRINKRLIEDEFIENFWYNIKTLVLELKATFFDTTTCLAFEYFKENKVDVAIIETGLGGKLDSTNIIDPEAVIITPIDFDHRKQLGNTLTQIASEKGGIIKNSCPVFLANQKKEVNDFFETHFKPDQIIKMKDQIGNLRINSLLDKTLFSFQDKSRNKYFDNLELKLLGAHQVENACLAYLAGSYYLENIKIEFIDKLFRKTLSSLDWPGRIQKISSHPDVYLDVSHNESGFKSTLDFIKAKFNKSNLKLLIGLLDDKDFKEIVQDVKNVFSEIWITEPESHRKLSGEILVNEFNQHGISVLFVKDISKSFESLSKNLNPEDILFIMGSHYLAGQILSMNHKIT